MIVILTIVATLIFGITMGLIMEPSPSRIPPRPRPKAPPPPQNVKPPKEAKKYI